MFISDWFPSISVVFSGELGIGTAWHYALRPLLLLALLDAASWEKPALWRVSPSVEVTRSWWNGLTTWMNAAPTIIHTHTARRSHHNISHTEILKHVYIYIYVYIYIHINMICINYICLYFTIHMDMCLTYFIHM